MPSNTSAPSNEVIKHFPELWYSVKAIPRGYHVDFSFYHITGLDADNAHVYSPHYAANIDEAIPEITGHVKWDGCSNWNLAPNNVMLHGCGADDLLNVGKIMHECWKMTESLIPDKWFN